MVACGILSDPKVDFALAAHVTPKFDAGTYWIQEGPVTANPDFFTLKIYGNGAHGSEPQSSVDALNMGVQICQLLQTFVSRVSNPCSEVVLSVCTFHSGTSQGNIPGECELSGTVRSFLPEIQQQAKQFIDRCARSVTELYGGRYELNYRMACFPVVNDSALTQQVCRNTAEFIGQRNVITQAEKFMGGEDFCFISGKVPSTFVFVGCRNEALFPAAPLHSPRFNLDESVLARTSAVLAYNTLKLLNR